MSLSRDTLHWLANKHFRSVLIPNFDSRLGKEGLGGYIFYDKENISSGYKIHVKVLSKL